MQNPISTSFLNRAWQQFNADTHTDTLWVPGGQRRKGLRWQTPAYWILNWSSNALHDIPPSSKIHPFLEENKDYIVKPYSFFEGLSAILSVEESQWRCAWKGRGTEVVRLRGTKYLWDRQGHSGTTGRDRAAVKGKLLALLTRKPVTQAWVHFYWWSKKKKSLIIHTHFLKCILKKGFFLSLSLSLQPLFPEMCETYNPAFLSLS